MTTHHKEGDSIERLYLEIRLKSDIVAGDLGGVIIPIETRTVFIPTAVEMQKAAQAAVDELTALIALRK
jgi:hypothetical protein